MRKNSSYSLIVDGKFSIVMSQRLIITVLLFSLLNLGVSGQIRSREYWKQIADESRAVIIGTVKEEYVVIRPEKFKLNPDRSIPTDNEIYAGVVFRIEVTKKLKGKIKAEKIGESKYVNIFLPGAHPTLGISSPKIYTGSEYVFFLELNSDEQLKELKERKTIEFLQNGETISIPFEYESSYFVVQGIDGAVRIKTDKEKLIEEIKRAIN